MFWLCQGDGVCVKTLKPSLGKCYVETSFGKCYVFSPHTSLSSNFACTCPLHPHTPRLCVCVHCTHTHPDTVYVFISPTPTQTLCMCSFHPHTPRHCACVRFTHTHPDTLTQKKREESESTVFTKMPSPHYMEVATLILNTSVHSLHTH